MELKSIKRKSTFKSRSYAESILFVLPWSIGFLLFFAYPIFSSIQLSFSRIDHLINYNMSFVGMQNYYSALFFNTEYVPILINSIITTVVMIPCIVFIAMILAIILNGKIAVRGFFRSIFFLPVLLGTGFVMQQLLGTGSTDGSTAGAVSGIMMPQQLLSQLNPQVLSVITLIFSNLTMILWKSGVQIIIFLAGLQSIPKSVYESAKVDSASEWEIFWKITMPMLAPITVLNLIYTIVDSFTDLSNPVIKYILDTSQNQTLFGQVAAMSWIYLLFVMVVMAIVFIFSRKYTDGVYSK